MQGSRLDYSLVLLFFDTFLFGSAHQIYCPLAHGISHVYQICILSEGVLSGRFLKLHAISSTVCSMELSSRITSRTSKTARRLVLDWCCAELGLVRLEGSASQFGAKTARRRIHFRHFFEKKTAPRHFLFFRSQHAITHVGPSLCPSPNLT